MSGRLRATLMRWGWNRSRHDKWITGRIFHIASRRRPWWSWGDVVMALTGEPWGGRYDAPTMPAWFWRHGKPKRMRGTGFPVRSRKSVELVKGSAAFAPIFDAAANDDERYEWSAIHFMDGELTIGHRYWGGALATCRKDEVWIVRSYLRAWRRHNWWGVRSWLWAQGLHASVYERRPFGCNASPPSSGHGGYDYWLCQLSRRHDGPHRYKALTWSDDQPLMHDDVVADIRRTVTGEVTS